jgi:hypothetical protein
MLTSQQNKSMVIIFAYFDRADAAAADDVKMKPIFIIIQNFDFSWL